MSGYGSRKFIAFIVSQVLVFASLWGGLLTGDNVEAIEQIIIPAYMIGNIGEHFAKRTPK